MVRIVLNTPLIDVEPAATPLPVALMDDAEKARLETAPEGEGAIRAAVALDAGPKPAPAE